MDKEQQVSERIESFVMGRMTPEEEQVFRAEMDADPDLANRVDLHFMMKEVLGNKDLMEFRNKVRHVMISEGRKEISKNTGKAKGRFMKWAGVAAVILLAGIMTWSLFFRVPSPARLYARYFEAYPVYQVSRSGDHEAKFQEAMEYYGAGRFGEAQALLLQILEPGREQNDIAQFYYGISCMETGEIKLAEETFRGLISGGAGLFDQQSRWYLALVLIKQERIEEAVPVLSGLSGEPGKFGRDAASLLSDLRMR